MTFVEKKVSELREMCLQDEDARVLTAFFDGEVIDHIACSSDTFGFVTKGGKCFVLDLNTSQVKAFQISEVKK